MVARFLAEHDRGQPDSSLIAALLEECGGRDHLLVYDSDRVLKSEEARRTRVPPDLRPIEADGLNGAEPGTFASR